MQISKADLMMAQMQANQGRQEAVVGNSRVSAADAQKIKELSQEFESIFTEMMLSSMRKTVEKSNLVDGGNAEEIFRGMLDSEYSKVMSKTNSNGIASAIEKDLLKSMQYQSANPGKAQGIKAYKTESLQEGGNKETIMVGSTPNISEGSLRPKVR